VRIVYDYAGRGPAVPVPASSTARGGEKVIVVRLGEAEGGKAPGARAAPGQEITSEALARDREVRGHERTHLAALGPYAASDIQYDTVSTSGGSVAGGSIAVGGRIAVDLAEVPGDPAATIRKAKAVFAAANAPGDPSAADLRVAARAYRLMQEAQAELKTDEMA